MINKTVLFGLGTAAGYWLRELQLEAYIRRAMRRAHAATCPNCDPAWDDDDDWDDDEDGQEKVISLPILRRRMLYDGGLEHPQQAAEMMGMVPLSEDGHEREVEESSRRQAQVVPLMPLIAEQAGWMSSVLASMHDDLDEERIEALFDTFQSVTRATLLGSLSVLADLGIIDVLAYTEFGFVDVDG